MGAGLAAGAATNSYYGGYGYGYGYPSYSYGYGYPSYGYGYGYPSYGHSGYSYSGYGYAPAYYGDGYGYSGYGYANPHYGRPVLCLRWRTVHSPALGASALPLLTQHQGRPPHERRLVTPT